MSTTSPAARVDQLLEGTWSELTASLVTPGPRPWAGRRRGALLPWLLGIWALLAAALVSSVYQGSWIPPEWGWIGWVPAVGLLVGLPLTARRPLLGWLVTGTTLLVIGASSAPVEPGTGELPSWLWVAWWPVLLIAGWAAVARPAVVVWAFSLLVTVVVVVVTPWQLPAADLLTPLLLTAAPLAAGTVLRTRQRGRDAVAAERRRTAEARDAGIALAERARIAREMHDVVAHHLSLVAVRAETAPYRLPDLEPRATDELAHIADAARAAMAEMQQLLGVLRAEGTATTRPQPGLGDVGALLVTARSAGTDVTWELADVPVPDGIGLTGYRVVAQGLANAAQHASGAPVRVRVVVEPVGHCLLVEVLSGAGPDRGPGSGSGIRGLEERVAVHDGTLTAQPTADGGFQLLAVLPLPVHEAARRG